MSFYQPKFSSCALWNTNAKTFANESWVGQQPAAIFISVQNNIYMGNRQNGHIVVWENESSIPTGSISGNFINSWSLFVTHNGNVYVDNGYFYHRIDTWLLNATSNEPAMYVNVSCTGLFIDINSSLYCSSADQHRVFRVSFNSDKIRPIVVAGTGCPGPVLNMLDHPHGIFVDNKFNLYVADTHNNRIQRFELDGLNAITVAGFGATITFILNNPTGVILDADGQLFIVDSHNHRIVRSISNEFQCLLGCSGSSGAAPSQLNNPQTMVFDKSGNIFMTDMNNHRVQKFILTQNSCGTYVQYRSGWLRKCPSHLE